VLSKPVAEFPEGYANLVSVRELTDGRVMTVETCERVVKILDLRAGQAVQMSRTGAGPGEYRGPGRLFALPGDSSVTYDAPNRRYLVVGPTGQPGRMFEPLPSVTESRGGGAIVYGFSPLHTDDQGRFYSRETDRRLNDEGKITRADSIAILRWSPRTGQVDTLFFTPPNGPPGLIDLGNPVPFTMGTQWAVAPDGTIGLVDPRTYRVQLVLPGGRRIGGTPIPHVPLRLSEGLKEEWRRDQAPACPARTVSVAGAEGRPVTARPMPAREPTEWPAVIPPIVSGGVEFAPDGRLWVRRSTPAGQPWTYDVFDAQARLVGRIVLPSATRFLGFGKAAVYLTRRDEDDLLFVEKYDLPR
jgi:hypothetical protein